MKGCYYSKSNVRPSDAQAWLAPSRFSSGRNTMSRFWVKTTAKLSPLCACLFVMTLTAGRAQQTPAPSQPVIVGPLTARRPVLVPFTFRQPNGVMTTIQLRRLPASCVIRETAGAVATAPLAALRSTKNTLSGRLRVRSKQDSALFNRQAAPAAASVIPTGTPRPAALSEPQLFNSMLDYSHDRNADFGWLFPTRGYDPRHTPGGFRVSLNSLIYPTDPPTTDANHQTHTYDNFGAPVELIQLGHAAQISTLRVPLGAARETQGSPNPIVDLNSPGCIAVILFWDGVYNDLTNGFAVDPQSNAPRLATDGTGASGVIVQLGAGFNEYIFNFDNDGSGTKGRFRITDPKGRMAMTVAAVYDPNAVDAGGNPVSSSREDGVYLRPGASVGQNKYFLIKHGNLNVGGAIYDDNGVATTQSMITFSPGDNDSGVAYDVTTQDADGSVAYQVAPADLNINPGEGQAVTVNGVTRVVPVYAPLNSAFVLYGTNLDGSHAALGELRGRVRQQGVDPDRAASPTKVVSPYDPTPAAPSLPLVPGESKMNRFRFTFISPPINAVDVNKFTLWDPASQIRGNYTFFQQETYAMPSYGDNSPIGGKTGGALRYNYRLRGIPVGTYSVLVQAIPIAAIVPMINSAPIVQTDMFTPYNYFPGSDFNGSFTQTVTIGESLFNPPMGDLSELNYDNYTNPTILDVKVHRLADVTGGVGDTPDGSIDSSDFGLLIGEFNDRFLVAGSEPFDITGGMDGIPDGSVDSSDFSVFIGDYGQGVAEGVGY